MKKHCEQTQHFFNLVPLKQQHLNIKKHKKEAVTNFINKKLKKRNINKT